MWSFVYTDDPLEIIVNGEKLDYDINKVLPIPTLREDFNQSLRKLYKNSLIHNSTRIFERNTLVNDFFLDFCRLKFLSNLLLEHSSVTIKSNRVSLFLELKKKVRYSKITLLIFTLKSFQESYLMPYLKTVKYFLDSILLHILFSKPKNAKDLSNSIILNSYVGSNSFRLGAYHDMYYGDMQESFKKRNLKAYTWPLLSNCKKKIKALKLFRRSQQDFVFLIDYLKIKDYFSIFSIFFKKRNFNFGTLKISSVDFTNLLIFYQKKELGESDIFIHSLIKRFSDLSFQKVIFIVHQENLIPDRLLNYSVKKYMKNSKVVGFFHTLMPDNILNLNYMERPIIQPDLILFNSKYFMNNFISKNKNVTNIELGYSYKQNYLSKELIKTHKSINSKKILVVFSGVRSDNALILELISKIEKSDISFLVRFHPMMVKNEISSLGHIDYIEDTKDNLSDTFKSVDKVISVYSSVAVEAAIMGKSVGLVYDKKRLIINPFDNTNISNYSKISNQQDLLKFLKSSVKYKRLENIFNVSNLYREKAVSSVLNCRNL